MAHPSVCFQFKIWSKFPVPISIVGIYSFPGEGDVWFSLDGTTYQNNSIVTLEDVGEDDNALLCITNYTACCRPPYTGEMGHVLGNWFFPNGTRVPSASGQWDICRTRGQMVVRMYCRRGGVEGINYCEIPDAMNVTQTIYIGVYSASTGEWIQCSAVAEEWDSQYQSWWLILWIFLRWSSNFNMTVKFHPMRMVLHSVLSVISLLKVLVQTWCQSLVIFWGCGLRQM